jgi:hypothetical protein
MAAEERSGLTQVLDHRWSAVPWPIARLTVRLEHIATRNGLTLQNWIEDGLGPATGCAGRLPSGVVIELVELADAVAHHGVRVRTSTPTRRTHSASASTPCSPRPSPRLASRLPTSIGATSRRRRIPAAALDGSLNLL